jgi:DNA-binding NtrC family response regulator
LSLPGGAVAVYTGFVAVGMDQLETTPEQVERTPELDVVRGLLFVHPEERFVPLGEGKLTLGRDAACSVKLEGALVSRVHASIRRVGTTHVLTDENSRNGTRRNGEAVGEAILDDEDVLRIGDWVGSVLRLPRSSVQSGSLFGEPSPGIVVGPRTQDLWRRLQVLAPSRVSVLLVAPTGCGKEVFARELHRGSGRPGPFIAQNCAAMPDALVEAQLFGHMKGAFTGATRASGGLFGDADGGTLLLDEIADLSLAQQAKLLRVIEERAVVPLGATKPRSVDVRLLAASQVSLRERVEQGYFRGDLLARLAGATLEIPTLEARREEIPRLFACMFSAVGADPGRLRPSFVEKLCLLAWPFNVRQLRLIAENMALHHPTGPLNAAELEDTLSENTSILPAPPSPGAVAPGDRATPVRAEAPQPLGRRRAAWLERHRAQADLLEAAVRRHAGNVSSAARELGISRQRAQRLVLAMEERTTNSGGAGVASRRR